MPWMRCFHRLQTPQGATGKFENRRGRESPFPVCYPSPHVSVTSERIDESTPTLQDDRLTRRNLCASSSGECEAQYQLRNRKTCAMAAILPASKCASGRVFSSSIAGPVFARWASNCIANSKTAPSLRTFLFRSEEH